ncbi:protein kinase [Hamiltosporidium tvaerminnensis]|uniref:non-specific serine/threonine protein kinase n=4 Tax=Hamiltosporidium TaxID=1176354 RepID=A0A4V2JUJ3_9MICR|nr:Eukaryotic translation initiation factor 2-alpha kinase [Hamiltosporidium tvaerminnensis]TBT98046.1 protein kinase [Hamiltosporidium tvaerminnensis]TBU00112.1 protein kinase [Hamiltosporidium magnivora]TBU02494.1 protein kinase [Hamiltosporidium magnivora]TBU08376.1 protein kinase [Hamiltosporidium tvaerminnensis]
MEKDCLMKMYLESFNILEISGKGSSGKVYKVKNTKSNEEMALKEILIDGSKTRLMVLREYLNLSGHVNILKYYKICFCSRLVNIKNFGNFETEISSESDSEDYLISDKEIYRKIKNNKIYFEETYDIKKNIKKYRNSEKSDLNYKIEISDEKYMKENRLNFYDKNSYEKSNNSYETIIKSYDKMSLCDGCNNIKKQDYYFYLLTSYCVCSLRNLIEERNLVYEQKSLKEIVDSKDKIEFNLTKYDINGIFKGIIRGVLFLHKNNVIHRDIKPENIFFIEKEFYVPKIGDFGSCKIFTKSENSSDDDILMTEGIGTAWYCAPESTNSFYSEKIDIYSLGLIYLEMIYPFITSMERAIIFNYIRENGKLPNWLKNDFKKESIIIEKCIKKNPIERISALELFSLVLELTETNKKI